MSYLQILVILTVFAVRKSEGAISSYKRNGVRNITDIFVCFQSKSFNGFMIIYESQSVIFNPITNFQFGMKNDDARQMCTISTEVVPQWINRNTIYCNIRCKQFGSDVCSYVSIRGESMILRISLESRIDISKM